MRSTAFTICAAYFGKPGRGFAPPSLHCFPLCWVAAIVLRFGVFFFAFLSLLRIASILFSKCNIIDLKAAGTK